MAATTNHPFGACRLQNSVSFPNPLKCGFAELLGICRNGFLHSGWRIPLPYGHFRCRITPGASSSTLQEFGADLVDIANVRGELAAVSQDIGDTELQRCSDPTESKFRARAAPHPSECS